MATDLFIAKTKSKAGDMAKKLAKTAREEVIEMKKSAVQQVSGSEQPQRPSPVVEAMQQGVVPVSEAQHENIHHDEKRRLDYLEKELEDLRRKRKWEEEQKQMAATQQQSQTENTLLRPLEIPTSKPKRGMFSSKKKQGTKEMSKQISG